MATGINLANAYVNVVPSFRGVQSRIQQGLAGGAGAAGDRAAATFGSRLRKGLGRVAKVGAVAVGAAVGAAVIGGFRSAVQQQTAEKVLGGLYGSASAATRVMKQLRDVSSKSPIEYDSYTKAAQSLAYAGLEGDSAVKVLDNVGKAVVATGGTGQGMDSISRALLKGVNAGKFQMDTLNQISDSGVPIYDALATHFGKTTGEIQKMASAGQIGLKDVLAVMEDGTGDIWEAQNAAAVEASKTFGNTFKTIKDNVQVAIGQKMLPLLERLTPVLQTIGTAMVGWIDGLDFSSWQNFLGSLGGGAVFEGVRDSLTKISPAVQDLMAGFKAAAPAAASLGSGAMTVLSGAISWVGNNMDKIVKSLPFLLAGFAAWRIAVQAQTTAFALQAPILAYSNTLRFSAAMMELRAAAATRASALATGTNTAATTTNNAATNMGVLARGRAVATMVAQRTATIATAVATKVATVAQWAFGAALRFAMGPIGWIITGITLLVAGLVWFFTQTKVGQAIVQVAWTAIQAAIGFVVTWFTTVAWPAIQTAIAALGQWFSWLNTNIIQPVWNAIRNAISAAWNFIKPIFGFIVNFIKNVLIIYFKLLWTVVQIVWKSIQIAIKVAWAVIKVIFNAIVAFVKNVLGPIFQWLWNNIIKPVWNFIKAYITTTWAGIKIIFKAIVSFLRDTLGPIFEWLYNNVIKPVWGNIKTSINNVWKFVRDKIFDPMKNAVQNTLPKAFEKGKDAIGKAWDKLKKVAKAPVKFVLETIVQKGIIDNFNKIASVFNVDPVDDIWPIKGWETGGHTGSGPKHKPAGIVHADEFVVQKASRRRFERDNPGALDHLNRTGRLPAYGGYASGGRVGGTLIDAANWWIAKGAAGSRHPAFGGAVRSGHSRGSMHYQDKAVDLNLPGTSGVHPKELAFFDKYVAEFKRLFPGIRTIWRAKDHFNHMHIDTKNGADVGDFSGASSGGGLLNILGPFEGLFDKIKSGITNSGVFGDLVAGGAKKMVEAPIEWIKSKASMIGDVFEGVQDAVGTGTTKARVRAVATARGWGAGQQWKDLSALIEQESSWDKNAANPTSSARGLFQKMTSLHGPLEKTVEGQTGWGLNYIKNTYGSPSAAWAFHKRNNWYDGGGQVSPYVFDGGGMLENNMLAIHRKRQPDAVLSTAQWSDMHHIATTVGESGSGITIEGDVVIKANSEEEGRAAFRGFYNEVKRQQRGGRYAAV